MSFSFTNLTAPVYDLTGSYQFDQQALAAGGTPVNLSLGFAVQQDATGRLRGSGATNVLVGNVSLPPRIASTGRSSAAEAKRHALRSRFTGRRRAAGSNAPFTISVQYNLEVSQGFLNGTAVGRAKFGKSGSGRINTSLYGVPLPAGLDGSWTVTMNFQPSGGTGSIVLSNGRSLQTSLASSFSARTGLARIKLTGAGSDRGNTLSLSFLPATSAVESLSGKLLGQTVMLKSPSGTVTSQTSAPSAFAGYQACLECHSPVQQTLNSTVHTPQAGVQCENCHGPAANHAANDYDPVSRPNLDLPLAGTSCGACHSTYTNEWSKSGHAIVVEDLNPSDLTSSCGRCHSGSVRVSLVDGTPLPEGDANVPLGCPTCHQPHQLTGNPVQLRNPVASTNDYFLTTTSIFTNNYDPNINLCANATTTAAPRGRNSSAPPHPSPQYNILLGTIGELDSGPAQYEPGSHALSDHQPVRRLPHANDPYGEPGSAGGLTSSVGSG